MNSLIFVLVVLAIVGEVQSFMGSLGKTRSGVRGSTIVMDGKTRDLRDRIKSIKQTRRITEAMRLVAAARVRRAQDAVLKSRPLIAQLQLVSICLRICSPLVDGMLGGDLSKGKS